MKFDYKKLLPHLVALALFYTIVITYFSPYFEGYTLQQGDVMHWKGMAKEVFDHRYSENEDPKWTNSMFGGMPAYQITNLDHSNKLRWIHNSFSFNMKNGLGNLLIAFVGFYILLVLIGLNPWLSIVGGIAFGLSTYNIIILTAGHNTKLGAIGWMPAVLGAVLFIYKNDKREILGLFLLALFMGLELFANHVQITYYLAGLIGIVVVQRFIESLMRSQFILFLRKTIIIVIAVLIGVMCNFGLLFNTYRYSKQTIRGKSELIAQKDKEKEAEAKKNKGRDGLDFDYITNWSLGKQETASIFLANVKGGASGEILRSLEGVKGNSDIRKLKSAVNSFYQKNSSLVNQGGYIKSYWGDQPFTSGPIYMGVTVFLLFILGLVLDKGYLRWTAIVASIIFVMLAWGKNFEIFNRFMVEYIPMYNKFRAVSMTMVVVQLLLPLIGFWGLHLLIKRRDDLNPMKVYLPICFVVILLLGFLVVPELFFTFVSGLEEMQLNQSNQNQEYIRLMNLVQDYRIDLFKTDVKRALLYTFLIGGVIVGYIKFKFSYKVLIGAIGILVLGDLWTQDHEYQNNEKQKGSKSYVHWQKEKKNKVPYKASRADLAIAAQEFSLNPDFALKYIDAEKVYKNYKKRIGKKRGIKNHEKEELRFKVLRDNTHYRVLKLGNPFNDASVSYFHKSIGGYHAAKLMRYQELIENAINKEMSLIQGSFESQNIDVIQNSMKNAPVLNMLNMKYLIYNSNGQPLINNYANGSAWAIKDLIFVENPTEEIEQVSKINSKTQALVDKRFESQFSKSTKFGNDTVVIELNSAKSNELKYFFKSNGNQIVVFSDIYYEDGWQAYLDDEPVDHFRANYVLRGLCVPSGNHQITFKFEPQTLAVGMIVNTVFSIFVLGGLLFFLFKDFKKSKGSVLVETPKSQ